MIERTFNSNRTIATVTNVKIETGDIIKDNDLGFFNNDTWAVSLQINDDGFFFTADDGKRRFYTETYNFSEMAYSVKAFRTYKLEVIIIIHEAIEHWLTS